MDLTTVNDLSGSLVAGDTFVLRPEAVPTQQTVQLVAGFFIEGDLDLTPLVRGGDYRVRRASPLH